MPRSLFYGWIIVGASMLITASSGPGQSYLFSVFIDSIIADTGLTRTTVSSLYAAGTFVSAGMVFWVSRLSDRRGQRWALTLIGLGFGSACFGMAFAQGWLLTSLALASLRGLGQGAIPINSTLLIAQWFVRTRGRAMAVYGLGAAGATAALPSLGRWLITVVGWRGAYFVFGVAVLTILLSLAAFVVRNRPEDMGLYPDGASTPPAGEPTPGSAGLAARPNVLRTRMFWLLALPLAVPSLVDTGLIFHQASLFAARGIGPETAALVFAPYAIATAGSSFVAGFMADRLGPKRLFVIGISILVFPALLLQVITSSTTALLYAVVLGTGEGINGMVGRIIWAHYYGRHGLGAVQGSAMMLTITGSALGPVALSALHDVFNGYAVGLTIMAGLMALAGVMMATLAPNRPPQPAPATFQSASAARSDNGR